MITPLYPQACCAAARHGNTEAIKLLVECGADPNRINQHNMETALYVAACCGHTDAVSLLIEFGADVQQPGAADGTTPLHIATQFEHTTTVEVLSRAGAHPISARPKEASIKQRVELKLLSCRDDAVSWSLLGALGGGRVDGKTYTQEECLTNVHRIDSALPSRKQEHDEAVAVVVVHPSGYPKHRIMEKEKCAACVVQ